MTTKYVFILGALAFVGVLSASCGDDDAQPNTEIDPCEILSEVCLDCSDMAMRTECNDVAEADDHDGCETGLTDFVEACDPCEQVAGLCADCPDEATQTDCEGVADADDHDSCEEELPTFQEQCAAG